MSDAASTGNIESDEPFLRVELKDLRVDAEGDWSTVDGLHIDDGMAPPVGYALRELQPGKPMPATIPDELRDVFQEPALGHVSYLNSKGQIVTFPMWVDFDGTHVLTSSPAGSKKGKAFRQRPQVSVSIVSPKNPWHWVSISGRVVDIRPDENLAFIDRLARRYLGTDYARRTPREIFTIEIDRVSPTHVWG